MKDESTNVLTPMPFCVHLQNLATNKSLSIPNATIEPDRPRSGYRKNFVLIVLADAMPFSFGSSMA